MSGHFVEVWSPDLCTRCLGQGREKNLKYAITDKQELSMLQLKCVECRWLETKASAVGNELRKRLLKAEGRARSRVLCNDDRRAFHNARRDVHRRDRTGRQITAKQVMHSSAHSFLNNVPEAFGVGTWGSFQNSTRVSVLAA